MALSSHTLGSFFQPEFFSDGVGPAVNQLVKEDNLLMVLMTDGVQRRNG